jgi:hypothetical protein
MKFSYSKHVGEISHLTDEQKLSYLENRAYDALLHFGVSVYILPPKEERFFLCPITIVEAEKGKLRFFNCDIGRKSEISVFKTERLFVRIIKMALKKAQAKRAADRRENEISL